jgi:hypothetical protein
MNQYSIMTSAAEYVTSYHMGAVSLGTSVNQAKRMTKEEARETLRKVKANIDSGAEMFENPK